MSEALKGYGARAVKLGVIKDYKRTKTKVVGFWFAQKAIQKHVKSYDVDLSECVMQNTTDYRRFGDYYARVLKPEARIFDTTPCSLTSPCDGWASAHFINSFSLIPQGECLYSLKKLLDDSTDAREYAEGFAVIIYLDERDSHTFSFFDGGTISKRRIVAADKSKDSVSIYGDRVCTIIKTDNFNSAAQIEVCGNPKGIEQFDVEENQMFARGRVKGRFISGNAAIILLFKKGVMHPDDEILVNSGAGKLTRVKMGEKIGTALGL